MTAVLGISAFYHDAAAALIVDGELVAAAQEERFTRKKHDERFPQEAIGYCLAQAGLGIKDLDFVGFYEKPYLTFERLLETYVAFAPRGFSSFVRALPVWMREKLHVPRLIRKGLGGEYKKRIIFAEHHESHAASAFYPSPFDEAAVLTMDGVGEWATASIAHGQGNRLHIEREMHFPHSLGLLYSAFTYFAGFKVNSGEYKLMGLAPYGQPIYAELIKDKLIDLKADGSFRMDMQYFSYCQGLTMTSKRMDQLFGGPPRKSESPITQREMDLAASIQVVTEEIVLRCAQTAHEITGSKNLCMAGGVALNCVANGRLLREGPFDNIWVQPAAGDAGGALGVASLIWHQLMDQPRQAVASDSQSGTLLGPGFTPLQVQASLDRLGAVYRRFEAEDELCDVVADALAQEKVVGWMQGRMEFGPRALGARSILGDPRSASMQTTMNLKIKFRESFRPFAPSILEEHVEEFFQMREGQESPYMLLVADMQADKLVEADGEQRLGLDKLSAIRSVVPAITHVDGSARVQTVDAKRHGRYRKLLEAFYATTGCPLLVNTSFNVRGEPIVCTPDDAYRCFMATNMDVLVVEDVVLWKEEQPSAQVHEAEAYLANFELD